MQDARTRVPAVLGEGATVALVADVRSRFDHPAEMSDALARVNAEIDALFDGSEDDGQDDPVGGHRRPLLVGVEHVEEAA